MGRLPFILLRSVFAVVLIGGFGQVRVEASEGHDHATEALPAVRLSSIDDAVNAVAYFHRDVESHIVAGELAKVHASAFAARDAATSIPQFASTLPEAARQELATAVQRIGSIAVQLDKYGDAGKPQETAAFAGRLRQEVEGLQRLTGVTVRADWKPTFLEGAAAAGHGHAASRCPHKANHGGRFSMALNDVYHVEGSYPVAGEFRMHFYDKDSCPIPAQPFSGRLLLGDAQQQVELVQASDGSHLLGRLPSAVSPPLSLTAIVRLPDPQTGSVITEHFSYNFYRLSRPPSANAGASPSSTTTTTTTTSAPTPGH